MVLENFWAKRDPFQSVVTHGLVSGFVCKTLFTQYISQGTKKLLSSLLDLSIEQCAEFVAYLASIHDIGKIELGFQSNDPALSSMLSEEGCCNFGSQKVRHEKTGVAVISGIWEKQCQDDDAIDIFAAILRGHHQGKGGEGAYTNDSFFRTFQEQYEERMRERFVGEFVRLPQIPDSDEGAFEAILLGLIILSDWIASGEQFSDAETWIGMPDADQVIVQKTERFLYDSGLSPHNVSWGKEFTEVWPWIPQSGMRLLQRQVAELFCEEEKWSLVLIEAPMGEGKTEAGMYAAVQMMHRWQKDGFYIALPTSATSNQMVLRMREWFSANNMADQVRLLHAMAWLVDESMRDYSSNSEESDEIRRWLAPLRRGLLGQYSVGTIDQAMLAVSTAKYSVLRLLGLSNKVLVFDEIHSYDVYMEEFICTLLAWCKALQIPVVMLSATLPPELKKKLLKCYSVRELSSSYPLITAISDAGIKEIPVKETVKKGTVDIELLPILNSTDEIAEKAAALVEKGGCLCVLVNTVSMAQEVFSALESRFDGELLLFHGQFPAEQRTDIERLCIQKFGKDKNHRPKRAILVATQVVEQSLDVDFDTMLTAIAPIDLVIQRMGRVFRHASTPRPEHLRNPKLWIMVPQKDELGKNALVYQEVLLRQSIHVLRDREQICIPEDLAELVAAGYDREKAPAELQTMWFEQFAGDSLQAGLPHKFLIAHPEKQYFATTLQDSIFTDDGFNQYLSVQTRLGEPSVRLALLEPELYAQVSAVTVMRNGKKRAEIADRQLAKKVLAQSVSVQKNRILFAESDLLCIEGAILLSGVIILPAEEGICTLDGGRICFHKKLGLKIKEG